MIFQPWLQVEGIMNTAQSIKIRTLLEPGFYDHPVDRVDMIETHISWVFLAGDFAYKVKKPLNFGFLDFSSLARRRHFCHEELRLNRRFAPQLYLEVVGIGGSPEQPRLHGRPELEYAVKMKRFPARQQLDRMQAAGRLTADHMEYFADLMAQVHEQAPLAGQSQEFGSPDQIAAPISQNFSQLKPLLPAAMQPRLNELEQWSQVACQRLRPILQQRRQQGFIRECHGDVHLANMAWFQDEPLLFDCIEFNESLRWIDLINDIAFLVMDLDDRGEQGLGWQFLNRYLQHTGDYHGMALLDFYKIYRAMVRAKVAALRLSQDDLSPAERAEDQRLVRSYLDLAAGYTAGSRPHLIITHGLSGSGKTTFVNQLVAHCGALSLQSDLERKRLHKLPATASSQSPVGGGIYSDQASTAAYQRLQLLADGLLRVGVSVIIDATFIKRQMRAMMRQLAEKHRIPLLILDFPLAEKELERRIEQRARTTDQASEATRQVLHYQLKQAEPLGHDELKDVIQIGPATNVEQVAAQVAGRIDA